MLRPACSDGCRLRVDLPVLDGEGGAAEGQAGRGRAQKGRYLRLVLTGCILPADLVTAIGPLITEMRCMDCKSTNKHPWHT
jgi:hypothetical protein